MASRIMHLAVAKKLLEEYPLQDENRFKVGVILPDVYYRTLYTVGSSMKSIIGIPDCREMWSNLLLTEKMAEKFIELAVNVCREEIKAIRSGGVLLDEMEYTWSSEMIVQPG